MFKTFAEHPHVGTNGGTAAGLVGSYDTVAERILRFGNLGIELFMLQFQPFETEMRRFTEEVIPVFDGWKGSPRRTLPTRPPEPLG